MRHQRLWLCLAAGSFVLALTVGGVRGQVKIQTLPVGAGAVGKGPTAIVLPGYEDAPRPPAFDAKMRALVAELDKAVDTYTPQPAWAGQTRAPKPARIAAYEVETFAGSQPGTGVVEPTTGPQTNMSGALKSMTPRR